MKFHLKNNFKITFLLLTSILLFSNKSRTISAFPFKIALTNGVLLEYIAKCN